MPYIDKEKERKWFRDRYARNVEYVNALKLERGCADCGYNKHVAALVFDHVKEPKRGNVANQLGKSLKIILEEIALCEVVCANCHAIREYERNAGIRTDGAHKYYQDRKGLRVNVPDAGVIRTDGL